MEFLRGSIVSYPVICTPSHSCASVSLSSSAYQSRSHVLAACSTRRPKFITCHTISKGCDDGYIFLRSTYGFIDTSTHTHTQEYVPFHVVVDDVVCTMTHYPPLSTFDPYDSDTPIDLLGLFSLVDLFGCFLLASPSTHVFVFIGAVQPLPYSLNRYTVNIAVLTLESPSSYLLAWLKGNSIILGLRYRLAVSSSSLACPPRRRLR